MDKLVMNLQKIKSEAREGVEKGVITSDYKANRAEVCEMLNRALATEMVCVLRYRFHAQMAQGINSEAVSAEFLEHSQEELGHADLLSERIAQLGGKPDLNPDTFRGRSHADYVECNSLTEMIKENLVAERIAIQSYSEMIRYLGENDPTTRRLLETILAKEEEHADDLSKLTETPGGLK